MNTAIYAVPVSGQWLIYFPFENSALLSDRPKVGFQVPESGWFPQPPSDPDPVFLGIITTRACNMACLYCGFGAAKAPADKMDLKLAAASIEWMADQCRTRNKKLLNIHFFGGEPLLAFDVIEVSVHRARLLASEYGLFPHFEVSTNGLIPDRRIPFVGDYFDTVVLSIDGSPEFQNRYRPMKSGKTSFKPIARNIRKLSSMQAQLCLRVCVTAESVSMMYDMARFLADEFQPAIINWEVLQETSESEAAGLYRPDPYEFAIHFIETRRVLKRLGIRSVYAADIVPEARYTFCPLGRDARIVTPQGLVNSCYLQEREWVEKGLDLSEGTMDSQSGMHLNPDVRSRILAHVCGKPECDGCFCRWSCAGGCHVNHSFPGRTYRQSPFCLQTRIISAVSLLEKMGNEELSNELIRDDSALEYLALHDPDFVHGRRMKQ